MPIPALAMGALIGGGLGLLRSKQQQSEVERQNKAQAAITAYSPWTGMQGQMQARPSSFGGVLQGAALGAMAGGMAPGASEATSAGLSSSAASGAAPAAIAPTTANAGAGVGLGASPVAQNAAQNEAFNQSAMNYGKPAVSMFSQIPGLDAGQQQEQMMTPVSGGSGMEQQSKWAQMGQNQPGMYNRRYF